MRSYRRPGRYATSGAPGAPGSAAGAAGNDDELSMGTGWSVFSYLISGLLAYGGIGWVIGHFTHVSLFFPIGMLVGLAISTGWIVYKYGRPHQQGNPPKGDDRGPAISRPPRRAATFSAGAGIPRPGLTTLTSGSCSASAGGTSPSPS